LLDKSQPLLVAILALQDMAAEWINRCARKKPIAQAKQFYVM